jgi:hypothetical protein
MMRILKKHIGVVLMMLVGLQHIAAQNYPVNASINITPPYSVFLADYVAPGANKLTVNLLLTQQNRPSFPVKLRLTIKGDGVTIRTNPEVTQQPIVLQGGVMTSIGGNQLAPYLEANSLLFEGYSKAQYQKTGKLPEGVYQITVEALELNRSLVISNSGTTIGWFILNDPPRINSPQNEELVAATDPQRVYFQWLPLHRNSPNSAFTTEYELTIVEIYPAGRNPNDAILSSSPVAQIKTTNSSLLYDQTYPALIPGREYAVRIKAKDMGGLDLFKNDGYSEVMKFTFGEACNMPVNIRAESETPLRGKIQWEGQHNHSEFTVKYREANNPQANWFEEKTFSTSISMTDLKPGTKYEYTVQPACGTIKGKESTVYQFTTLEQIPTEYEINCGNGNQPVTVDNTTQLQSGYVGMTIKVGLFDMRVTKIEGSNGTFSGEGAIFVPYLISTIKVAFSGIKVNGSGEMYEGDVRAFKTGLALLSAAEIAQIAASQSANELKNEICQPEDENEGGETDPAIPVFSVGDIVITLNDTVPIAKGDTITVNGEKVIADENTKFKDGDVVVVNGKKIVVGQDNVKQEGGGVGTGINIKEDGSDALNDKIQNYIEDALKALRDTNEELLKQNRSSVETLSQQMKTKIEEQHLIPAIIIGKDGELVGEGMSSRITVPDENFVDNNQPIIEIYTMHREIYVKDSDLNKNKEKDEAINIYLNGKKIKDDALTKAFIDRVYEKLGQIGEDSLKYYDKNNASRKEIESVVKFYVEEAIEDDLVMDNNAQGYNFDIAYEDLLAFAGNSSNPSFSDERTYNNNDVPNDIVAMTPAVRAAALHKIIVDKNRKVGIIDPGRPIDLPIGVAQNLSGIDYIIAIEDMLFTAQGASFDAFMSMEVPFTTKSLAFSTSGVTFTPGGMKVASAKMLLMKDYPLRLSNKIKLTLKAEDSKTFVEFDCNGFKSLAINGEFEFCETMIVPENEEGEVVEGERVKARFATVITDWNDFIISAEIDPFQLPSQPGLSFSVTQAVLDMSDINNPTGIKFPDEYSSSYFVGGNANMWRGFYLQQAVVKLPNQIKDKEKEGKRIEIGRK